MNDWNARIRQRAYEIWEAEGRPEGREQDHWERACREVEAEGETGATQQQQDAAVSGGGAAPPHSAGQEAPPKSAQTSPAQSRRQ